MVVLFIWESPHAKLYLLCSLTVHSLSIFLTYVKEKAAKQVQSTQVGLGGEQREPNEE